MFSNLPDFNKFKRDCQGILQSHLSDPSSAFPHLGRQIYGLPIKQTTEPIIISSITGAGKTYDLLQWLVKDKNYRRKGAPKLIIAFKEIKLLAEFVSEFYALVKGQNKSDYDHLTRYVSLVYGDTDRAIEALLEDYDTTGNEAAKTAADFLEKAKASTTLSGRRREELEDASILHNARKPVESCFRWYYCWT
jgi:hypothetical protein